MEVQLDRDQTEKLAMITDMLEKHEELSRNATDKQVRDWHVRTASVLRNVVDTLFIKIGALKVATEQTPPAQPTEPTEQTS